MSAIISSSTFANSSASSFFVRKVLECVVLPNHSQWSLRARAFCPLDPSKYSCIQNEHIKGYTEGCSVAEFERGGMKIILRGNLDAGPCSVERYQPGQIKFLTNVSSECIFSKSNCNEEGQMLHDKGSPTQDVACRCDLTQNYDLISRQTASRYCKPSEGDCSCFKKQCHLLDYSCISTPPIGKNPLPNTLRNEPVPPFIVQRNITEREKINRSTCTTIIVIVIILAFPMSVLLFYDQRIGKFIDKQFRKVQNCAGSRMQTSETDFSDEPNPEKEGSTTPAKIIIEQADETDANDQNLANNESDKCCIKVTQWIKSSKINSFCSGGKPVFNESIHDKWKKLETDTKCSITVEPCDKTVLKKGWIAKTNKDFMNILFMSGTLNSIKTDIILCPVNKELVPIVFDSEVLMGGLNKEELEEELQKDDVVRIYNPENFNCHCLLLTVFEDLNIKNHSDFREQKVATQVIHTLVTNGFRSLGISLKNNKSPEWKMFAFKLLTCLLKSKSELKSPVVVYCFDAVDEFDSLDDYIQRELNNDKYLVPITTEHLEYKEGEKSIEVLVEQGSILDYDAKVDVLINSVGVSLNLRNGIVSQKLVEKAGKSVQDKCKENYKNGINIGDIAITSAGHMICQKIFHVALYINFVCDGNISTEILKNIVIRCLKAAEKSEMTSIAFPALGTGTLGYPPCLVAKTMFAAVDEYEKTNPTYLKRVVFVVFEDNVVFQIFENIGKWKKNKVTANIKYDIPPKQLVFIHKDLETRVNVTDKEYVTSLKYKDLKAVVTQSGEV
ncbi:PARP10_14_15 [Mytilus edulis]|uniref:PARP10_14_15 n=1 Tax=Mytilus edulis TaxID=6550 RepID=A0A8S3SNR4_MYTED|nr:PARP10_14_15 [Mytilus edulis]